MEEILFAILEFLFEAVLDLIVTFVGVFILLVVSRSLSVVTGISEEERPWLEFTGYVLIGAILGGVSLFAPSASAHARHSFPRSQSSDHSPRHWIFHGPNRQQG